MEQAFTFTPISTNSAKSAGSSCVLRLIFSAGIPAAMARRTSYPEEASIWIPFLLKILSMEELGHAFMA
jgi:hypothetical protein